MSAARRLPPPDVVHAHDLDTLPAGAAIARRAGARLVYDAHEIYAEFELDPPRLYRAAAYRLERRLAARADAVVTVSDAIAAELTALLGLTRAPLVALNCPARAEVDGSGSEGGPLRAVYQAAAGPGRHVEDILAAAARVNGVEFTLRVLGADERELRAEAERLGLTGRVTVAAPVAADALVAALVPFDVGLIIDRPTTRNNELSLPNKLFEYLMAGLAVVVPRLPGMTPLVEGEGLGMTYEPGRPDLLADALAALARDRGLLAGMRQRARALALDRFNAETQSEALARAWGL